jgi:uncharacterized damage-inducible protein DinB
MIGPLEDAFNHHVWASLRVLEACATLQPEQLQTSVPGTYGTILDTVRHLVGSDRWYLFVMTGGAVPQIDEDHMALDGLRSAMTENQEHWTALLAEDRAPDLDIVQRLDDGSEFHAPMGIRLAGGPPRNRPPQPDLHRPHDARDRAPADRRLGLRRGRRPH